MNIPEILVANGTGAVLVSFLLLLRVRGEGKNSVGTELFCRMLVVTLLAQATETLSFLLDGVPGAAAELGVYRGQFARCVNRLLPDRTLYLFDSFQGFDQAAGAGEAIQAAHEKTSAEQVLAVMPNPERVVLKPGFFPESLEGLEETFCFVSLDVDFEPATLAGLRYFWPRLSPGGYLMLHDWGNPGLPGPALALARYQAELGRRLPAAPIPDLNGTLVLCKM